MHHNVDRIKAESECGSQSFLGNSVHLPNIETTKRR
jgi:hypothetical protein